MGSRSVGSFIPLRLRNAAFYFLSLSLFLLVLKSEMVSLVCMWQGWGERMRQREALHLKLGMYLVLLRRSRTSAD